MSDDFEPSVSYVGINDELRAKIEAALREVYDPELPVNIYDLGLIYTLEANEAGEIAITMTLTNPHCPVAETLPEEVRAAVAALDQVTKATISLTWTPAWSKDRLSPEHQLLFSVMF